MTDEVYYRIHIAENGTLVVVCLQEFDERDYEPRQWLSDTKFETEDDAQEVVDGIYRFIGRYYL